jgi:beta-glucosidase
VEAARKKYFAMEYNPNNWAWNVSWFSDPVVLGKYPEDGLEIYKEYLPVITEEDMKLINQPLDFLGQNIYHGYFIKADENGNPVDVPYFPGFPETGVNWPVLPRALYYGMKFAYDRYKLPIIVTENGMANTDVISLDGKVHDPQRIDYLDRYLSELQRAYDEGVDIKGYFLWSFTDNFEWEQGYHGRFGMVYIDFNDLRRIPKDSAYWFKDIMESNGKKLSINK